jgi:2'-5' RNA ligase
MEKVRAFIALEMPDEIRRALDEISMNLRKELSAARLRWVPVENMHLTLKFIGDIAVDKVPSIIEILKTQSAPFAPFDLSVDGLGAFPNLQRARVIWVGVNAARPLYDFQRDIESSLADLGFTPESRAFSPHLTLARLRGHARSADLDRIRGVLAATPKPSPTKGIADKITLFSSELKPSGSVYNALSRFLLSGQD